MIAFLILSQLLVFVAKAVDFVYLYQIKEYRFDRTLSHIKEKGFIKTIYNSDLKFPAKKQRNFIVVAGIMIVTPFLYLSMEKLQIEQVVMTIPTIPIVAFISTSFFVGLTEILAQIKRKKIIKNAKEKYLQTKPKIIAISGTYGKTSTKEFIYQMLKKKYKVAKTEKNMNTTVRVAHSFIKNVKEDTEYFIAEMGAYSLGEVAEICKIFKPSYAVLTSSGNQHIDLFGSRENLIKAEAEHLSFLDNEGVAYINIDIPNIEKTIANIPAKIKTFSHKENLEKAFCKIEQIKIKEKGSYAKVRVGEQEINLDINIQGEHVVKNLLPCIMLSLDLGLTKNDIIKTIRDLKPIKNKLSLHKGINSSTVMSDTNNSNLEGFIQAIKIANRSTKEKKIIATKGIIELGKEKLNSYEQILKELEKTDIKLATTDQDFVRIKTDHVIDYHENDEELLEYLKNNSNKDTLIVLEGRFTQEFINTIITT